MVLPTEKVPIVKDEKCFMCSLQLITVRGGNHVLYVADDGTIMKEETLFRYKERIKRRKNKNGTEINRNKSKE